MPDKGQHDRRMQQMLTQLESLLHQELAQHAQLAGVLEQKRGALLKADPAQVAALCAQENACVQATSELAKQRMSLVADVALLVEPNATEPMRLRDLAERLDEPVRGRLLVLRQQLAEGMERVRRQTSVAQRATDSLVRHMQGVVQSLAAAMADVGVYSRAGRLPASVTKMSTFSTTA